MGSITAYGCGVLLGAFISFAMSVYWKNRADEALKEKQQELDELDNDYWSDVEREVRRRLKAK